MGAKTIVNATSPGIPEDATIIFVYAVRPTSAPQRITTLVLKVKCTP